MYVAMNVAITIASEVTVITWVNEVSDSFQIIPNITLSAPAPIDNKQVS